MEKLKVYIASPYTKGDVEANVGQSFKIFNELLNYGFIPFAPLALHFIHMTYPQSCETWLEYDLAWLKDCNILLRLPGESAGADREVEAAKKACIPVYYDIQSLYKDYGIDQ